MGVKGKHVFFRLYLKGTYLNMEESRIWLLAAKKISNEATPQELAELDAIFKSNPGLRYAFSIIEGIKRPSAGDYGLSPDEENDLVEKRLSEFDMVLRLTEEKEHLRSRRIISGKMIRVAACVFAVVSLSVIFYFYSGGEHNQTASRPGRKTNDAYRAGTPTFVTLQDGTQVWLNKGTTLKCAPDFNKKNREVILSGEAYFDVSPNANKPFIVRAGHFMKVKVLGTTFNLKAYPHDPYIEASLITGKIAIDMSGDKKSGIILNPHQKITFYLNDSSRRNDQLHRRTENQESYHIHSITPNPVDRHLSELSWMRGELAFNDMPFNELAYDLERIYQVNISFEDADLKEYHLTGVFKGESLDEVLAALQVTTPFHYDISNKEVIIHR